MRFPAPSCHRPIATHFHFLPPQTLQVLHSRVVPLHCSVLQVPEWSRKTSEAGGLKAFWKSNETQMDTEKMMQHSYPSISLSFARSLPLSLSLSHLSIMHKYKYDIDIYHLFQTYHSFIFMSGHFQYEASISGGQSVCCISGAGPSAFCSPVKGY